MRILPQCASPSYWLFPTMLALPAPAPPAGLLPARVPSSIQVELAPKRRYVTEYERQHAFWAAQDAENAAYLAGARERIAAALAKTEPHSASKPVQPTVLEVSRAS